MNNQLFQFKLTDINMELTFGLAMIAALLTCLAIDYGLYSLKGGVYITILLAFAIILSIAFGVMGYRFTTDALTRWGELKKRIEKETKEKIS